MRPILFVAAHEWKLKESVAADVLGGPQPQSNANRVVGRLRAAEDVRPYRKIWLFWEMWHDLWCSGNEVMERGGFVVLNMNLKCFPCS